jgi:hypothetical protein
LCSLTTKTLDLFYRKRRNFYLLDEGDHPTISTTKPNNRSQKSAPLKLSNKTRNELNKKLETAGGV